MEQKSDAKRFAESFDRAPSWMAGNAIRTIYSLRGNFTAHSDLGEIYTFPDGSKVCFFEPRHPTSCNPVLRAEVVE